MVDLEMSACVGKDLVDRAGGDTEEMTVDYFVSKSR
jgi:hypothetical protein